MKACANTKCPYHFEVDDSVLRAGIVARRIPAPIPVTPDADVNGSTTQIEYTRLFAYFDARYSRVIPAYYLCENCHKARKG
ncbi:hypothetical protein METEAL_15500 [Mesoterricola silvestris]|uniref:Uncharacterized protein n=1 Tax=Mesoterricola silvestris TaxID=2927979 RepID=A0AA48GV40_9BACT|nr:hypothetical protein METEAL_15500 [Mesoterricola silvestris]